MFAVEVYAAVRRFVFVEGQSRREAARVFGLSRETVGKMCRFSLPPGYTRTTPIAKPKLGAWLPVIETQIVSEVITNAIKYSHARGEPGKVSVSCHSLADSQLEIEIIDDGTGLAQPFDALTAGGLGLRLIRALTGQIGAQSGFQSSVAGTRFWLRLESAPKANAR